MGTLRSLSYNCRAKGQSLDREISESRSSEEKLSGTGASEEQLTPLADTPRAETQKPG